VAALTVAFEAAAFACPICFQVDDAATTNGVRAAVFVLIGVTTAVLAGFAWFILRFARRAASMPLPPEHEPAGAVGGRGGVAAGASTGSRTDL
jgi:hypothetical protein